MMRSLIGLLVAMLALQKSVSGGDAVTLTTRDASFRVDDRGALGAITRRSDGRDYLAPNQPAPLLSLRIAGKWLAPTGGVWDAASGRLTLRYPQAKARAVVAATAKPTHVVFETVEVEPAADVEVVLWGSYPIAIGETVGEVIGVVRDREFAVGIQALNLKTLGGYPTRESDVEDEFSADDRGYYPDLPDELKKGQHFRADTARPTEFGSVLHAYCRNRTRPRVIANWGHDKFEAPAFDDGGVVGSRIALFACPEPQTLETIGAIEVAEGLPHPMLDGVWAKTAPNADCSYLIIDFSEDTIDRAIEMTQRAGLAYLYHSSPFETWGHFELKPSLFPNGWDGLKACVEKARQAGLRVGVHTLSNFITPNDAYVTPKPEPGLARIGTSALAAAVDAVQTEITVAEPDFFKKPTALNTVAIGDELVRYDAVSTNAPWRLLKCQRGAWGTSATAHAAGSAVGRLMDHSYNTFLTDPRLTAEVARNLARLCNHAGLQQISLDGLEGAWSTGMGQYGRTLFAQTWYANLAPELKGCINDASNPGHFNWHAYTRMNWGEPWYAGFRESQTLYRFKNQFHFTRNLMPRMLGWFALRPETSLADVEWLLARAAGFDAGFALAGSLASTAQLQADPNSAEAARQFGAVPAILETIKHWETARLAGVFPADVKARLRDNNREFQFRAAGNGQWRLYEVQTGRFTHEAGPTGPRATTVTFTNRNAGQPLRWTLHSTGKRPLARVRLLVNGRAVLDLTEQAIPPSGSVTYRGGAEATICDAAWKELARVPVPSDAARVTAGEASVTFGCEPQDEAQLKLELSTLDEGTEIRPAATPPSR